MKTICNQLNIKTFSCFDCTSQVGVKQKIVDQLQSFCYGLDTEDTRSQIAGIIKKIAIDAGSGSCKVCIDDLDDDAKDDELARSCQSFAEYMLKKSVMTGDDAGISIDEFKRRHCYDRDALNVYVEVEQPVEKCCCLI